MMLSSTAAPGWVRELDTIDTHRARNVGSAEFMTSQPSHIRLLPHAAPPG